MSEKEPTLDEADICNRPVFETIKDFNIICSICLGILLNPKQCEMCETSLCEGCIKTWLSKNNSCPMRCKNYKIVDPPRMLRNMLSKLEFRCKKCLKCFFYDSFIAHINNCKGIINSVKCPFCSNCDINKEVIESYSLKSIETYKNENIYLKSEIESYKEMVAILNEELKRSQPQININPHKSQSDKFSSTIGGPSSFKLPIGKNLNGRTPIYMKWAKYHKKNDYVLSEGDKKIEIKYTSCDNFHFADYIFNSDVEESITIKVLNKGEGFHLHFIGFINDVYKMECPCLNKPHAWYIQNEGEELREGNKVKISNPKMAMVAGTEKIYQFVINGHTGKLVVYNEKGNSYGTTYMTGTNFKFFVSKCNNGNFEYTFL